MPSDQPSWADAIGKAFNWVAKAFRVVPYGFDGSAYQPLAVDSDGNVAVAPTLVATTAAAALVEIDTGGDTVLAANPDRKRAWIQNVGAGYVRLEFGDTPTTDSPIRLVPQVGAYEIAPTAAGHIYTGEVTGIAESGTNDVLTLEEE